MEWMVSMNSRVYPLLSVSGPPPYVQGAGSHFLMNSIINRMERRKRLLENWGSQIVELENFIQFKHNLHGDIKRIVSSIRINWNWLSLDPRLHLSWATAELAKMWDPSTFTKMITRSHRLGRTIDRPGKDNRPTRNDLPSHPNAPTPTTSGKLLVARKQKSKPSKISHHIEMLL